MAFNTGIDLFAKFNLFTLLCHQQQAQLCWFVGQNMESHFTFIFAYICDWDRCLDYIDSQCVPFPYHNLIFIFRLSISSEMLKQCILYWTWTLNRTYQSQFPTFWHLRSQNYLIYLLFEWWKLYSACMTTLLLLRKNDQFHTEAFCWKEGGEKEVENILNVVKNVRCMPNSGSCILNLINVFTSCAEAPATPFI